jgi:hypothetical protein
VGALIRTHAILERKNKKKKNKKKAGKEKVVR